MATNDELAEKYRCSRRTIQRMRRRGVDVDDVNAVARFVLGNPSAPLPMIEAIIELGEQQPGGSWQTGWKEALTTQDL